MNGVVTLLKCVGGGHASEPGIMAGVHARVRQLEGSITVTSRLDDGTRWTLSFPLPSFSR